MNFITRIREFFGQGEPKVPAADPFEMSNNVRAAYALLADANKKAIQVPPEVVKVITEARKVKGQFPDELEAKFWNAYGLLSSSIRPAAQARNLYRNIFYIVLLLLLFAQFFFMAGDFVRTKLADIDKQVIDIRGRAAVQSASAAPGGPKAAVDEQIEQVQQTKKAYLFLSKNLLDIAGTIADLPLRPFGFHSFFSENVIDPDGVIVGGKLNMLLAFLSGFLLPMLYGLLGACAFVLRKLSDEIDKLTYANDARVRYSLRLNIGLLSGLAVGWFIKPGAGDATLVSLSPLALAFVAGYGSDLFFVALDKIVQAFAPAPTPPSSGPIAEKSAPDTPTTTVDEAKPIVATKENGNADTNVEGNKTVPPDAADGGGSNNVSADSSQKAGTANRS